MSEQDERMMVILDQMKLTVATFSGMRQQFVDAGWSTTAAESLLIEMYRKST